MALPTSLSGLATGVATVGPFISSAGNVYLFGKDGTTATTLQAYKATDPTTSFSSIATNTGFATAIQFLAGYQNGDTIHLAVIDGATTSCNLKYRTFNMATDAFVTSETVQSAFNPQTSGSANVYACAIIFRASDSQPIILYNGAHVAVMSSSYSRVVYAVRTGTNTWTNNVAVDAGGATDFQIPKAVLGSSNRSHFLWTDNGTGLYHRALNSSNVLQTATTKNTAAISNPYGGVSYNASGTQKIVVAGVPISGSAGGAVYFDSADTPTLNADTSLGTSVNLSRLFTDSGNVWHLYVRLTDGDIYVSESTDNGATFGSSTSVMVATADTSGLGLGNDGTVFTRGSSVIIPFVVNDNGTLKYNEYVIRTTGTITNQSCLATTTPTKSMNASIGASRKSSSTPTKSLLLATAIIRLASTTTTKSITKSAATSKQAQSSPTASIVAARVILMGIQGVTAPLISMLRAISRLAPGSIVLVTTMTHPVSAGRQAVSSPVATDRRVIAETRTSSSSPTAMLMRQGVNMPMVIVGPLATLIRSTVAKRPASTSVIVTMVRAIVEIKASVSSTAAKLVRQSAKAFFTTTSPSVVLIRSTTTRRQGSASLLASLVRSVTKAFSVSISPSAMLTAIKVVLKAIQASTSPIAGLIRSAGKAVQFSTSPLAALIRSMAAIRSGQTAPIATFARSDAKSVQGSSAPLASMRPSPGHAALASTAPIASLLRPLPQTLHTLTAPLASLVADYILNGLVLRALTRPVASLVTTLVQQLRRRMAFIIKRER